MFKIFKKKLKISNINGVYLKIDRNGIDIAEKGLLIEKENKRYFLYPLFSEKDFINEKEVLEWRLSKEIGNEVFGIIITTKQLGIIQKYLRDSLGNDLKLKDLEFLKSYIWDNFLLSQCF